MALEGPFPAQTTIERAFELARAGDYVTIEQIADRLKAERHEGVDALLFDAPTRLALRQACANGRQAAARTRGGGGVI